MRKAKNWLQPLAALVAAFPLYGLLVERAEAHVKWFCAFNVAGQPRGLENVLCPDFEYLVGLSALALMAGCLVEGTNVGLAMIRAIDRVTAYMRDNMETMYR